MALTPKVRRPIQLLRGLLLAVCALLFCVSPILAQAPQALLPDSFAGWNVTARSAFSASQAPNFEPAASAAATDEFGFVDASQWTYTRGSDTLHVTAYRMKDPSGAYGEYLYLRAPEMQRARFAERASLSGGRALILLGDVVLDVTGSNLPAHSDDLKALSAAVQPLTQAGALPTVTNHLPPARDIVPRSERYILGPRTLNQFLPLAPGDWLGFANGAEAALAKYRLGKQDRATLVVADYPTPQLAAYELRELGKQFNVNGMNTDAGSAPIFAKRSMTLVAIVAGAHSQAEADTILDQVQSGTQLTWDEPTFNLNQPGWSTIVAGIFVGTGVLCIFAVIAGIAFGGIRILVKRFFPGRVFDRANQIEVLQLGLSSKPIKAGDFYQFNGPS